MNRKIYALQVPPEFQTPPMCLFDDDDIFYGIMLVGNQDYKQHTEHIHGGLWDRIEQCFDDIAYDYERIGDDENGLYKSFKDLINDYFSPAKYEYELLEDSQYEKLEEVVQEFGTDAYYKGKTTLWMFNALTGEDWRETQITGCVQSQWQTVIYNSSVWSRDSLRGFEVEYFNLGTEWQIHDGEHKPMTQHDFEGCHYMYCRTFNPQNEIAEKYGVKPEDVVLWEFDGWTRSPKYKVD